MKCGKRSVPKKRKTAEKTTLVTFESPSDSTGIDADYNNEVISEAEASSIISLVTRFLELNVFMPHQERV
jgi:hypothetical protein